MRVRTPLPALLAALLLAAAAMRPADAAAPTAAGLDDGDDGDRPAVNHFDAVDFYVGLNFTYRGEEPVPIGIPSVAIVTQLSVDRLDNLERIAEVWNGPIELAVYIKTPSCVEEFHRRYTARPELYRYITVHFVLRSAERFYPVNYLRNVAWAHTRSDYVFLLDADLLPNLSHREMQAELRSAQGSPRTAFIAPAFQLAPGAPLPTTKAQLVRQATLENTAWQVHRFYDPAHGSIDYARWYTADAWYDITDVNAEFEPYMVVPVHAPRYDVRFKGYGLDKVSQVYEQGVAGYTFRVLSGAFLVHLDHEEAPWSSSISKRFSAAKAWRLWFYFVSDLRSRYSLRWNDLYEGMWVLNDEGERSDYLNGKWGDLLETFPTRSRVLSLSLPTYTEGPARSALLRGDPRPLARATEQYLASTPYYPDTWETCYDCECGHAVLWVVWLVCVGAAALYVERVRGLTRTARGERAVEWVDGVVARVRRIVTRRSRKYTPLLSPAGGKGGLGEGKK